MTEVNPQTKPAPAHRFRFSLGNMLLWIAVSSLSFALVITNRKLSQTQSELATLRPLPVEEVARQFEARTTLGPIKTIVKDVRYSPKEDAYKVEFSWLDSASGKTYFTDVKLASDGYGAYYGRILNDPFIIPLGRTSGFVVGVETASTLNK